MNILVKIATRVAVTTIMSAVTGDIISAYETAREITE